MFLSSSSEGGHPLSFQDHRILLPCISVGNAGQLTVDLIVNTLKLPRVGYLDHPAILPLVGNDAFDHTKLWPTGCLHTAAEVYHCEESKLLAVQLRAPLKKSLRGDFCAKLLEWVKEVGISEVVVLTSSHAHERRDSQITGEQFRFLLSPKASDSYTHFTEQLHWKPLEPRSVEESCDDQGSSPVLSQQGVLPACDVFLPGAGIARRLYKESSVLGIRLVVMVAFCAQGDNIQDAVAMADRLDTWTNINNTSAKKTTSSRGPCEKWLLPSSWSMMYGGPSPSNLF